MLRRIRQGQSIPDLLRLVKDDNLLSVTNGVNVEMPAVIRGLQMAFSVSIQYMRDPLNSDSLMVRQSSHLIIGTYLTGTTQPDSLAGLLIVWSWVWSQIL